MNTERIFLDACIKKFKHQKKLGDKTFEQLDEAGFLFKPSPDSNNIAIIVQHMYGNMMSRWTNFLTEDGEKEWRKRDEEFEDAVSSKDALIDMWENGWKLVFDTLQALQESDVAATVLIRKEPLSVCDAIIRQIDHYGYHVGQIVQLGKIVKDKDWSTLSIAKGKSKEFNDMMDKKQSNK